MNRTEEKEDKKADESTEEMKRKLKRDKKEVENIIEYLENEDFKATSWMKNDVYYNEATDDFEVIINFEFGPGGRFSYKGAKEMWLKSNMMLKNEIR